ncbi:MAG: hypothetical protein HN350_05555 [Phycisphaerales bacterium]|jgi:hypothetical protein|nr:hypothetical protein [Phycisphaerales bacterium]
MIRYLKLLVVLALLGVFACDAFAVRPAGWSQSTQAQFAKGKFESTVVNQRGDISLARKSEILLGSKDAPPVVSAIVVRGRTIYASAGNEPVIYAVDGKKFRKFATLPGTMITTMVLRGKDLLVGVGGDDAGIYILDAKGKSKKLWSEKDVKYIWAIHAIRDNKLYAATGPKGRIYLIDSKGKGQMLYETGDLAKNILSLALAGNTLYAGTDTKGLVVAIDTRSKSSRVILDAAEAEVSAIIPAPDGGLFVATADVAKASADGKTAPSNGAKNGKPSTSTKPSTKAKTPPVKKAPEKKPAAAPKPAPKPAKAPAKKDDKKAKTPEKPKPDPKAKTGKPKAVTATVGATTRPAGKTVKKPTTAKSAPSKKLVMSMASRIAAMKKAASSSKTSSASSSAKGNAVYHIQANGLVRTIFRKPVTILAMKLRDKKLILATGNGGAVYTVTTDGATTEQLIDTEAKQITAIAFLGKDIVFASANKGSVGTISGDLAKKGVYTSEALDAKQIVQWGTMRLAALSPNGAKVTVATRSGNLAKPDDKTWSSWSKEQTVNGGYLQIMCPSARFLQYRLTFTPGQDNAAPLVTKASMIYQMGNLAPVVSSVVYKTSSRKEEPTRVGPQKYRFLAIRAADPNADKLIFTLEYRRLGDDTWVQITDKQIKPVYIWDTQSVGDGEYELRVTAKDSPTNVATAALSGSRISERITVDNTAPVIKGLSTKANGTTATISGQVTDAGSRIAAIAYTIDSRDEWKTTLAADGICDSANERLAIQVKDLKPGAHRLAVQVTDLYGNITYGYTSVTIVKK